MRDGKRETTKVYGSLVNWESGKFVPVYDVRTGRAYYGGHQRWLMDEGVSKFYSDRSCCVTAISNMLVYMAQNIPEKANLFNKTGNNLSSANITNIEKSDFSALQKSVYDLILPAIWGVPTVNAIVERIQNFAFAKGVELRAFKNKKNWSEANVRNFIASGLNKNSPVLLITWNSAIPDLNLHWVTVTRLFEDSSGTKMITSNWGNQQTFDFSAWVNGSSVYKNVVYFE